MKILLIFAFVTYVTANSSSSNSGNCLLKNINIFIKNFQKKAVSSYEECEEFCKETTGCEVWKYVSDDACGNYRGICFAGQENYNNGRDNGVYSGYIPCKCGQGFAELNGSCVPYGNCLLKDINIYVNTNYYNGYRKFYNINNYTECSEKCQVTPTCEVWKYVSDSANYRNDQGTCYTGKINYNKGSYSGIYSGYKNCTCIDGFEQVTAGQCVAVPTVDWCFKNDTRYSVGGQNIDILHNILSAPDCQKECQDLPGCVAFVYHTTKQFCKRKNTYHEDDLMTANDYIVGKKFCEE